MRIPTGRRRLILVAVVALLAGGVAAATVIATRGGGGGPATTSGQRLAGQPPLVLQLPGGAVGKGNAAVYAAAKQRLPAGDVRLSVARAIMAYAPAHRARTVAALERLPQNNPAVAFALGMAQLWAGDPKAAEQSLERVKQLNPYGYYGTNADNLLHLNREVSGYPPYFPPTPPRGSLKSLNAAVEAQPQSAAAWLAVAAALERSDRLAASEAARKAAALDPNGVSEQVALAILGFNKDRPMDSLQPLLTLTSQPGVQQNPEVRFHLGIVYFWLRDGQDAAAQFRQVIQDAPNSRYAPVAKVFQTCIQSKAACTRIANSG
ncbi:MAG TPA: tetratricopeptide repeat protein [Gaiellales bacterium]|jgi:Tfp pilus assembly protein PilF|nr:tetratricopeptide repeat protein [Gaiellales bacterium]